MTVDYCPPDLRPDVVVKHDTPSLLMPDDEAVDHLRQCMTVEQLKAEMGAISTLAQQRSDFGVYGLLGLEPTHQAYSCICSGESLLNWMHAHERHRMNHLKMALPSSYEEAVAARLRIQARIAARRSLNRMNLASALQ